MALDAQSPSEENWDVTRGELRYHIFDWDDNILHMPTKILLEKKQDDGSWKPFPVSTSLFAMVRNDNENFRPPGSDWESAFVNFRDLGDRPESAFLSDTRLALQPIINGEKTGAPCFQLFKQTLIEGRLFAIVTARGHKPESIRAGVEYFIGNVLTQDERHQMMHNLRGYRKAFGEDVGVPDEDVVERYLSLNRYHAVTSPEFQTEILGRDGAGSENPEQAKQEAIRDFIEHIFGIIRQGPVERAVTIIFSDDDLGNIAAVRDYMETLLAKQYPHVSFVLYDTSGPEIELGKRIVLQGQLDLGI